MRHVTIELVLATDISCADRTILINHKYNAAVKAGDLDSSNSSYRLLVLILSIKCADIGCTMAPGATPILWGM